MKVLLIGDPHFKAKNKNETDIMHREILKTIENNGPYDFIVCMGDVMHNKNSITLSVYNRALEFLYDISRYSHLYLIVGNHDRQNEKDFLSDISPFKPLKGKDNVTVIDRPLKISIQDFDFTFVPFVEPGRFYEALSYTCDQHGNYQNWKDSDTIFAHQEFLGSTPSGVGDEWNENLPQVFTGHVHSYMKLWNGSVIYVSTPLQNSSIETGRKGIVEASYDKNNNNETLISHQFIDLNVPRIYTYSCNISDIYDFSYDELFKYFNTNPNISTLKIFVYGNTEDVKNCNWLKEINQYSNVQVHLRSIDSCEKTELNTSLNVDFWKKLYTNISKNSNCNQLYEIINNILAN